MICKANAVNLLLLLNMYNDTPYVDFLLNPHGFTTAWLDLNTTLPCYCKGLSTKPAQRELQLPLIPLVLGKHAKHLGLSRREPYYSWSIILLVL